MCARDFIYTFGLRDFISVLIIRDLCVARSHTTGACNPSRNRRALILITSDMKCNGRIRDGFGITVILAGERERNTGGIRETGEIPKSKRLLEKAPRESGAAAVTAKKGIQNKANGRARATGNRRENSWHSALLNRLYITYVCGVISSRYMYRVRYIV